MKDSASTDVFLCESQFVEKLKTLAAGDLETLFSVDGETLKKR